MARSGNRRKAVELTARCNFLSRCDIATEPLP